VIGVSPANDRKTDYSLALKPDRRYGSVNSRVAVDGAEAKRALPPCMALTAAACF